MAENKYTKADIFNVLKDVKEDLITCKEAFANKYKEIFAMPLDFGINELSRYIALEKGDPSEKVKRYKGSDICKQLEYTKAGIDLSCIRYQGEHKEIYSSGRDAAVSIFERHMQKYE